MNIEAIPIRVLGTRWCGDCRSARRVLDSAIDTIRDRIDRIANAKLTGLSFREVWGG